MVLMQSGRYEGFKAAVHGAALGLAGVMAFYNAAAWWQRRERHLALNTFVYTGAILWEVARVKHHLRDWRLPEL